MDIIQCALTSFIFKSLLGLLRRSTKHIVPQLPELEGYMQQVRDEGTTLSSMILPFVDDHAKHLTSLIAYPTPSQYDHYCKLIVSTYPEFADPLDPKGWVCFTKQLFCF